MSSPATLNGYTVIPVSYSSTSTHYLYARRHTGSKSRKDSKKSLPPDRTLFLVNVPPDATERELVLFFKQSGTVEKIVYDSDVKELNYEESDSESDDDEPMEDEDEEQETDRHKRRKIAKDDAPKASPLPSSDLRTLRRSGQSAHVIFLDSSSLDRALSPPKKPRPWPDSDSPQGLSHYFQLYKSLRPPLDSVRRHADTSMDVYEYELQKKKQTSKYKKGEAIVDEDGFTLVTRGGAYGQTLGGGVAVASKRFQNSGQTSKRNRKPKEKKEKEGFYAFQKAEKQRKELLDLKRKWEEDKAKVEKLKASRQFKPY